MPADQRIDLNITSRDVWHNFGSPDLRIKSDAIPGDYSQVWIQVSSEDVQAQGGEATFDVQCFELCGPGHSAMKGQVTVIPQDEWEEWYASTGNSSESASIDSAGVGLATPSGVSA